MAKVPNPITEPEKFHAFMKSVIRKMVRFMDNVIQFELDHSYKSPTEKQYQTVEALREIGLGILNLHAWFFNNGVVYDSQEAVNLTDEFFKWYQYYAFKASCELAIDRGPCPAWTKCNNEGRLESLQTPFLDNLFNEFPELKELYYTTGIRNGALLSIAPTGSISMLFPGFLSTGIEPLIGYAYWRKTRALSADQSYDYFFVFPEVIKGIILPLVTDDTDRAALSQIPASTLDNDGKFGLGVIDLIKKYVKLDLLKPAHEIDPFMKVKLMAACQKWNDAAISVTYNLPNSFTIEQVEKLYMAAFDEGLKSIAIYRDGCREGIYIFEDPITYAKKFEKTVTQSMKTRERPTDIMYHSAPKRPEVLDCDIHHCQIKGDKWIVLIGLLNGKPYELFAGKKNEDFNISRNIMNGKIIKEKKGVYSLIVPFGKSEIKSTNIAELFMNEEYKAITRMISLALRMGSYYEFITDQLKKSSDYIGDFASVVSRCLNKYIKETLADDSRYKCPVCN